jgi:riboflavin synthase
MFTGIIAAIGKIASVQAHGDGYRLKIDAQTLDLSDVILGDSIAIQGACMTVVALHPTENTFEIDISAESIQKTIGLNQVGPVNLEKALRLNDRLGGHLVSGHVDGIGKVAIFEVVKTSDIPSTNSSTEVPPTNNTSWHLAIDTPRSLAKYFAYKGSIVVNGTSLTVNLVEDLSDLEVPVCRVHINLIPHTLEHTTLQYLQAGDQVNLEVDLIARYVERMLSSSITGLK